MGTAFNSFRIIADMLHILSKVIMMWSIHWNRSAEGVSLITQALYVLVFVTRYLDIFVSDMFENLESFYIFVVKIFYIASSLYIVFLMTFAYARTREREKAWKFGIYCLVGSAVLAMPLCKIFEEGPIAGVNSNGRPHFLYSHTFTFRENLWVFSEVLESVCVLPQLLLLRQTTVPTVIDSYYLGFLGSYRALYLLGWIIRASSSKERHFDPIAVVFGIIQTALYIDFAWVYYSRQRVKLRAGGIVDSDDLDRGWLVNRFVGKHQDLSEENQAESNAESGLAGRNRWGTRGISVSADEDLDDAAEDARPLTDPAAFEDELTDDEDAPPVASKSVRVEDEEGSAVWNEGRA